MWEGMRGYQGVESSVRVHLKLVLPAMQMNERERNDSQDYERAVLFCCCFGNLLANS